MKTVVLAFMCLIAAIHCEGQDAGKVAIMKVYQTNASSYVPGIKIVYPDNTAENIELPLCKANTVEEENNLKKVREAIDKVISKGYDLKTSHEVATVTNTLGTNTITTYIFEKK